MKLRIPLINSIFVFDVIALTEAWINEENAIIFSLDGYIFCHRISSDNKGVGVAFYTTDRIQYHIIYNLSIYNCLECKTVK